MLEGETVLYTIDPEYGPEPGVVIHDDGDRLEVRFHDQKLWVSSSDVQLLLEGYN